MLHYSVVALQVYDALLDLTNRIIAHPKVQAQASELIANGTHSVLSDATVLQHGKDFVADGTFHST